MLEWLETHDRERDVIFGVAKGKDCTRIECSERIANALIRSGIFKGEKNAAEHPVNGSKVIKRLHRYVLIVLLVGNARISTTSRVREKYEELMRNFPRPFSAKSGQEMNQQDPDMFEQLCESGCFDGALRFERLTWTSTVILTKDFVEWRRWHEIFRNLPLQSRADTDKALAATSRKDHGPSPCTRGSVHTRRTTQNSEKASGSSKEKQSSIRVTGNRGRRGKKNSTPEASPSSQASSSDTPTQRAQSSIKTGGEGSTSVEDRQIELELQRERNNHEKLLLRRFELEMEERKRRDEHDRERERERYAVGLKFLESGFFNGGSQGKTN